MSDGMVTLYVYSQPPRTARLAPQESDGPTSVRTFVQLTRAWYAERELERKRFVEEFCLTCEPEPHTTSSEFTLRWYDFSALEGLPPRTRPLRLEVQVFYDSFAVCEDFGDLIIELAEWLKREGTDSPPQPVDVLAMLRRLGVEDATPETKDQ
jgi:hypothetical protein